MNTQLLPACLNFQFVIIPHKDAILYHTVQCIQALAYRPNQGILWAQQQAAPLTNLKALPIRMSLQIP